MRSFLMVFFSVLISFSAKANDGNGFFSGKQEGWFWYEDPVIEEYPKDQEEQVASSPVDDEKPDEEKPIETSFPVSPTPLSVEWFQENLSKYRNAAIDNPTKQNVETYMFLQRLAMDKASKFADMTQRVVMLNPILDEQTRRSIAPKGTQLMDKEAAKSQDSILTEIAKQAGIFFFFRSDCVYCHAQSPVLKILEQRFNFKIIPISLDGNPMPNGYYENFLIDNGQSENLSIVSTPALFLASPPDKITPISQGMLTLNDIMKRIVLSALESGIITEEQLDKTRPINSLLVLEPNPDKLTEEIMSDPKKLTQFLKKSFRPNHEKL